MLFSRYGFSAILAPLFVAASLLFLARALRRGRPREFLLSGLLTGAGLYTYPAFRLFALAMGPALILSLARRILAGRWDWRIFLGHCALWLLAVLAVYAPMARYAVDKPDGYWDRVDTLSGEAEETLGPDALWKGFRQALFILNWQGDSWLFPLGPEGDSITAALYILGLVAAFTAWLAGRREVWGYVLIGFLLLLVPAIYEAEGQPPSAIRTVAAAPWPPCWPLSPCIWPGARPPGARAGQASSPPRPPWPSSLPGPASSPSTCISTIGGTSSG